MSNCTAVVPYNDIEKMGGAIAKSNLFGIKTSEQAIALMLIAQAEGLHPAIAARDYHIIQGRPALKADAMLARFQQAGGSVKWIIMTDDKVSAVFSHPQGGSVEIDWDMARAKKADLGGKDMWKKYPRQMLRARVISEGIRSVFPGCVAGFYTPEEVQDFDNGPTTPAAPRMVKNVTPKKDDPAPAVTEQSVIEAEVVTTNDPGFPGPGIDDVRKACNDAVKRVGMEKVLTAIQEIQPGAKAVKEIDIVNFGAIIDAVNALQQEAA